MLYRLSLVNYHKARCTLASLAAYPAPLFQLWWLTDGLKRNLSGPEMGG